MGYKKVNDDSLILLADAIREKGGTNESLTFPGGFITAVESIGGTGCTLVVTAPPNVIVTAIKDADSFARTTDASGVATFTGLSTGTWTIEINNGSQMASRMVVITADYAVSIAFFAATITITYPAGSMCTCSDGVITLTAPDTSGTWECIVSKVGTWTIHCTDGTESTEEVVEITTDGQSVSVELSFWNGELYDSGNEYTAITGGFTEVTMALNNIYSATVSPTIERGIDYLKATQGAGGGTIATANKIDLSNYSKLRFTGEFKGTSSAGTSGLCVWSEYGTYMKDNLAASLPSKLNASVVDGELDISGLAPGQYYIGFFLYYSNSYFNITKIWLE